MEPSPRLLSAPVSSGSFNPWIFGLFPVADPPVPAAWLAAWLAALFSASNASWTALSCDRRMCTILFSMMTLSASSRSPSMYAPWYFITPASTSVTVIASTKGMPSSMSSKRSRSLASTLSTATSGHLVG